MARKYTSALNWLKSRIQDGDKREIRYMLAKIAPKLDADTIQDLFENEMDVDGFFDEQR